VPLLEELAVACDKRRHAAVTWEGVRSAGVMPRGDAAGNARVPVP
jgi:hypothetical protein